MDRLKTMDRLKKRAEFLTVARGDRVSRRGFVLQKGVPAAAMPERAARFGFTVTKKNGNSPERNRIRRRLREAVRLAAAPHALAGSDYVLVGRRAALSQPFDALLSDLISSLNALARDASDGSRQKRGAATGLSPATSGAHVKE
jgi:ribonuclease P protein component